MRKHDPDLNAIARAARLTLRRTCVAFGLDRLRFRLDVQMDEPIVYEIQLTYDPRDGREPFGQRRRLRTVRSAVARTLADLKTAVGEMVWNVALAFRPALPARPSGWSIHPAAASIIAAAGTPLPNPADPLTWLLRSDREVHLPDGGTIADAVFSGREGVLLLLKRASIVNSGGDVVATMSMDGAMTLITLPDEYPETFVVSLAGRSVDIICEVFTADARGAKASIKSARNKGPGPVMVIALVDKLVPLLPSNAGGERWRPKTAKEILGPPVSAAHELLGSSTHLIRRYYALSAKTHRKGHHAASATP